MQAANPAVMSLVFILAASLPAVAPDAGGVLQAATDVRINSITAEDQAETAIAVNPVNPMNLFATWRDLRAGRAAIGHAFSLDGGTTWQDGVIDYPQADLLYDPSVGADSEGNFYLAFGIDFLPAGSGSETWVMKSADGGDASRRFRAHRPGPAAFRCAQKQVRKNRLLIAAGQRI